MADLAFIEDVESRWRPLPIGSRERIVGQTWLTDASSMLRDAVTDVDARAADDTAYARKVTAIVAMAVVRALRGQDRSDPALYSGIFFYPNEIASLLSAGSTESSNLPIGSFPDAYAWPDPIQC